MKKPTKQEQLELDLDNSIRQLEKDANTLERVERHLKAHAVMNAALHCQEEVIPSPLYQQVLQTLKDIKKLLRVSKRKIKKFDAEQTKVE